MYTHIFSLEDGGDIDRFKLEVKMRQLKHPAIIIQNAVLFLYCVKHLLSEKKK